MLDNYGTETRENEAKQVEVVGDGVKEDEGCRMTEERETKHGGRSLLHVSYLNLFRGQEG